MYAVIKAGGKQEKVTSGQTLRVELLEASAGSEVSFSPVLVVDGDTVLIDRTTLVQNKNRNSTIWMLTNFGTPTIQDVLSVSKWVEFDDLKQSAAEYALRRKDKVEEYLYERDED
ncbi:MAG: hypothetical protein EBX51_03815, partial [Acidimicrobiia bacterium]|nr:hypothetical protein [Acidimicrobiia bacterium]